VQLTAGRGLDVRHGLILPEQASTTTKRREASERFRPSFRGGGGSACPTRPEGRCARNGRAARCARAYVGRICGAIALDSGEDAAQETLITVFRRLRSLREPEAIFGWVRTIAVREAVRVARAPLHAAPARPGEGLRPVGSVDVELAAEVRQVLERLPPDRRAILVLRDLHGVDEAEAARLLGIARGTVKSRLHRARALFRKEWNT
jgi:RNA polymerase sigma factor (sigma-70 family)